LMEQNFYIVCKLSRSFLSIKDSFQSLRPVVELKLRKYCKS